MRYRRRKRHFFGWAILLIVLFTGIYLSVLQRYRPVAQDLAQTQVKNKSSDLINDAIAKQIEQGSIHYDRIIYFEKDLNGKITALKTNMSEVNRLKTDILNIINDEILALDTQDIGVPLGSIVFPELLSGRGVQIPVRVMYISNSDAQFVSRFSEAGINQTLHQLIMDVKIDVTVLVLGRTQSFSVASQVVVAETVIVGVVPETFINLDGLPMK